MKTSTLVSVRRRLGRWLDYALPPEGDDDHTFPPPDPPPRPVQIPLPGLGTEQGGDTGATSCNRSHGAQTLP